MAKRSVITNKGMELLASSSEATGQYWWIGHYGLAYVPNYWKASPIDVPEIDDICDIVNGETIEITESESEGISPSMTKLTKKGDMIYNIFQGDLVGTGFYHCVSDGSVGGDLFGLTMYNTNIKKHYRYVLNEYGNNTLTTWVDYPDANDLSGETGLMIGKYVYLGTDGYAYSDIPIPAPLYYMGETAWDDTSDYFPRFNNEVTNGANIYPSISVEMDTDSDNDINVPAVSVDYREYLDSQQNGGKAVGGGLIDYPYNVGDSEDPTTRHLGSVGSDFFGALDIPASVDDEFDSTSWYAADLTFLSYDFDTAAEATVCKEFWKLLSISNYNRFHAPVGSVGHVLSSDLSNRNMSKVTKLFPISSYKVINTEDGVTSSGENVEVASAISIKIDLDLSPKVKAEGFEDEFFNETANLSFFDKYDLTAKTGVTQNTQEYYDGSADAVIEDQFATPTTERNIFNSAHTSFKFNRIGLYAVPLRKCPFLKDESDPTGKNVIIQFEINPDIEPILFAVVDWDNTVTLDDTGDGIHQFNADFNLNFSSGNLDADALVRDSTVYYNLYDDDALTWYQNQLVATASTQHSIAEIGLEVQNIKNRQGGDACPPPDLSKKYAPLNHTHRGINHARDGVTSGTIRGINTEFENTDITVQVDNYLDEQEADTLAYAMHQNATVFGSGNKVHASKNSAIVNGVNSTIYNSDKSAILVGDGNIIGDNASLSAIVSGIGNEIALSESVVIASGRNNKIIPTSDTEVSVFDSAILSGRDNTITGAGGSLIASGRENIIDVNDEHVPKDSAIVSGSANSLIGGYQSVIGAGENNKITDDIDDEVGNNAILSGSTNVIDVSTNSLIVGGFNNSIRSANNSSAILGGSSNIIENDVSRGTIVGGLDNTIKTEAHYSTVMGNSGIATQSSQLIHAAGSFVYAGDVQNSRTIFKGQTSGTQSTLLTLQGGGFYDLRAAFRNAHGSFSGTCKLHGHVDPITYNGGGIQVYQNNLGVWITEISVSTPGSADAINREGDIFTITGSVDGFNGTYTSLGSGGELLIQFISGNTTANLYEAGNLNLKLTTLSSSIVQTSQFTGYYDGTSLGTNESFVKNTNILPPTHTGGFVATSSFPTADVLDVVTNDHKLNVLAIGDTIDDSNVTIYWVAELDMLEIQRKP
jgi:hypothetical protein